MTLDLIKQTVGHYFNINLEDETNNKSRKRDNVESRMVYFHLSRFFTKKSLGDLGRSIKPHKDHSTVLHNIVQTENLLAFDKDFKRKHKDVKSMIEHYLRNTEYEDMSQGQKDYEILRLQKENLKLIKRNKVLLNEKKKYKTKLAAHRRYLLGVGYKINHERSSVFDILN